MFLKYPSQNEIFQGFELDAVLENDMSVVDDDDNEFSNEESEYSEYSDGRGESDDDGLFDRS